MNRVIQRLPTWLALAALVLLAAGCGNTAATPAADVPVPAKAGMVVVEVGYLPHPPAMAVVEELDRVFARFSSRIEVRRYDLTTPDGERFAQAHRLTGHTPVAVYIDGHLEFDVGGRKLRFTGFPQAEGWSAADVESVLRQKTGSAP